jgi:mRNA interferase RelE/StbE
VTFRVVVTRTAARQLADRLPEATATACVAFLFRPVADDPHRVGAPLRAALTGQWRARLGEYRFRYRIDDRDLLIYVLDIDHRRDAYRS